VLFGDAVMAIYHLSGTIVTRSQGRSSVACAAYRAGEKLYDERRELTHDFSKKRDVVYRDILLPENAPREFADRETLWNAVERAEKRKDAQLAREFNVSLPRELNLEQQIALVREYVNAQFVRLGMIADVAIHHDKTASGEEQPHAHIMLTMREVTEDGFGFKVTAWNAKERLLEWREAWANSANQHLALHGHDVQIDHRSYAAQQIELEPQHKIGTAAALSRMARLEDHERIAKENGERILENPGIALNALTRQQSTFTHHDIARLINRQSVSAEQFQAVYDKVLASPELVALGKDEKQRERFTTREMLALEVKLQQSVRDLNQQVAGHTVKEKYKEQALSQVNLSNEQQVAFEHIVDSGDVKCVLGYAGTGKSYLLGAAREAWEQQGYNVHGVTLSGIAAENLAASSGIESRTLASRCYYWDRDEQHLTKNDIVVVDEAGMLGSRQLSRIITEAERARAKVVLIGDPQQLQAIEAGAAFRAVCDELGYVELTEVRRQKEMWQQQATKDCAKGDVKRALDAYAQREHLHEFNTQDEAKTAIVRQWLESRTTEPEKSQLMLAYTRKDVSELNDLVRHELQQTGHLGLSENNQAFIVETARGHKEIAIGERLYCLQNDRHLSVMNGTLGTVTAIDAEHNSLSLKLDKGPVQGEGLELELNLNQYNHLDYGYAATIHKAQGVTVDRTQLLASTHLDSHASYVALSRHRESCDIFYSHEQFLSEKDLSWTLSRERHKDISLDYLSDNQDFNNDNRNNPLQEQEKQQNPYPAEVTQPFSERRGIDPHVLAIDRDDMEQCLAEFAQDMQDFREHQAEREAYIKEQLKGINPELEAFKREFEAENPELAQQLKAEFKAEQQQIREQIQQREQEKALAAQRAQEEKQRQLQLERSRELERGMEIDFD
jgi:Ti-type conjugative transfer relaxase TraA